jgi:hypothetical protein
LISAAAAKTKTMMTSTQTTPMPNVDSSGHTIHHRSASFNVFRSVSLIIHRFDSGYSGDLLPQSAAAIAIVGDQTM